jgi:hypothetical protein
MGLHYDVLFFTKCDRWRALSRLSIEGGTLDLLLLDAKHSHPLHSRSSPHPVSPHWNISLLISLAVTMERTMTMTMEKEKDVVCSSHVAARCMAN